MPQADDVLERAGLEFFGSMAAAISHELKNALAVINESAGLIQDLTEMAGSGTPLDPARVGAAAERIQKQIRKADGILKEMNRFAHSSDIPITQVEMGGLLQLAANLSRRAAEIHGVELDPLPADGPVPIRTDPFRLHNLLWRCMNFAIRHAGQGSRIRLKASRTAGETRILFTGLGKPAGGEPVAFPGDPEIRLLDSLKAELTLDVGGQALTVVLRHDRA